MGSRKSPSRRAGRAGLWIVAILAGIVLTLFVGRNIWHATTQESGDPAQIDPQDKPHSAHDLTVDPQPTK